jgi:DNA mismatch repair protein MutS
MQEPVFETACDHLILANHSLKQLNMIDDNNHTGKYSSVSKMLNAAITPMGKRAFTHMLLHPITDIDALKAEYGITEYALTSEMFKDKEVVSYPCEISIPTLLNDIKDIPKYMRKMMIKKITPQDLHNLCNNLNVISTIYEGTSKDHMFAQYFSQKHLGFLNLKEYCNEIIAFLQKHFLLDLCADIDVFHNFETNFIHRGINEELDTNTRVEMESKDKLYACQKYFNGLVESVTNTKKPKQQQLISSLSTSQAPALVLGESMEYVKLNETEKS